MHRHPTTPDESGTALERDKLDLDRTDLAAAKSDDRPKRSMPKPRDELSKDRKALLARAQSRPLPPQVALEPAGYDQEHWTAPHDDEELWWLQLCDAFGTRSYAVVIFFLSQIEALCGTSIWDEKTQQFRTDEVTFSAMLAIVNSVRPANEVEAALAAQMVSVHMMQMRTAARAVKYDDVRTATVAAKLAKVFSEQAQTLEVLKGRGKSTRQSIEVSKEAHQHIHYHEHREGAENGGRPQEPRTNSIEGSPALPGESKEHGHPMSGPSRVRQARLPQARRS